MSEYLDEIKMIAGNKDYILVGKRGGNGFWVESASDDLVVLKVRYRQRRRRFTPKQLDAFINKEELCSVKMV